MDILSSQANLAGYKAVVESFANFEKAIPMMMTAAGTVPAAKVLVVGAGGFIGGHLVKRLLENDNFIVAVDIKPKEYWFQDFDNVKNLDWS